MPKIENSDSSVKASNGRVTLLICSHESNNRLTKTLILRRSLNPSALKNQARTTCFVPEVESCLKKKCYTLRQY